MEDRKMACSATNSFLAASKIEIPQKGNPIITHTAHIEFGNRASSDLIWKKEES